jgi:hypothetical protein
MMRGALYAIAAAGVVAACGYAVLSAEPEDEYIPAKVPVVQPIPFAQTIPVPVVLPLATQTAGHRTSATCAT